MVTLLANEMRDRGYRPLVKGETTKKVGKLVDFLLSNKKKELKEISAIIGSAFSVLTFKNQV